MVYCDEDTLENNVSVPKSKEFTLYVNNLPVELNEHGLLQIFSHYGHIKGHFYRKNVSWAYITYGTYIEAESAVKDLHYLPPLWLKVSFAKERNLGKANTEKTNALKNVKDHSENQDASVGTFANKPLMKIDGACNPAHISKNVQPKLGLPECSYTLNEISYPHDFESCTYNPHRNAEPCAGITASGIRSKVTVTHDGKRHILYGRDPRMYEIPDPNPTVHDLVDKLFEKRTSGLYRYGKDTLQDAVGECKTCSKKTIFSCEKCYTFYCSRTCQVANWPQHKLECENIPALVPAMRSIPISEPNSKEPKLDKNIFNTQASVRRLETLPCERPSLNEINETISKEQDGSNITQLEVNPINKNSVSNVSSDLVNNKSEVPSKLCVNEKVRDPQKKLNSIVDMVTVGEKGILEVYEKLENDVYSISLLPVDATSDYAKLLYDLPSVCEQEAKHSNEKSNVGDLICGRRLDGNWLRGYILSPEPPLKMAVIDEARIMPIDKIVACPTESLSIPVYGAVCEITDPRYKLQADDQHSFRVTRKRVNDEQDGIEIEISQGQETVKAIVKHWMPITAQKPLKYVTLKNGSKVCLTAFPRANCVFVRPIDTAAEEYYNHLVRTVDKCAKSSTFLKQRPVVHQMVLARFLDDIFYRAIVVSCDQTKCNVFYIDIGYTLPVDIHQLKSPTDDLEYLPCCIAEVKLKGVPQNLPIGDYLKTCIGDLLEQQTSLTYRFDGISSEDGVYLDINKTTTLNGFIVDQLLPISKNIDAEYKTCYMMNDISIMELGNIGDTIKVFMLHPAQNKYSYAVLKFSDELFSTIMITMPDKMSEYGESSDPYIPRMNELCIVYCKGSWYRAVCEDPNHGRTTIMVYCIDSGETEVVNHTNIRLMPTKFLTPNAAANIIDISHMVPTNSNGQFSDKIEEMISEKLLFGKFITVKIIDRCPNSEIYKVTIPEIEKILKSDCLL